MNPPPATATGLSVILPASNEAGYLGGCLDALLASTPPADAPGALDGVEVIVVANACEDDTAAIARSHTAACTARGWRLEVLDLREGGKLNALNRGDAMARGPVRVYLDADVTVSPPLLGQIAQALARPGATWASGRPVVAPARSAVTRAYARFWSGLPFLTDGVPGFGIFAVNAAGRARWGAFPDIISDDTFVRLHFAPHERLGLPATYVWPMVEGFRQLVRVRRRQDAGVRQVERHFPALTANADPPAPRRPRLARLCLREPVGFAVYAAVALAVRLTAASGGGAWTRGR